MLYKTEYSKKYMLFFGIFCFLFSVTFAQIKEIDEITNSKLSYEEKLVAATTFLEKENDSIAYSYHRFSYWLFDYDINNAIAYEQKALTALQESKYYNEGKHNHWLFNLGYYLRKNKNYHQAITVFKELILLDGDYFTSTLNQLALCYQDLQDYASAAIYFEYYVANLEKNDSKRNQIRLIKSYFNIAAADLKIKTKESLRQGVYYAKKSDSILNTIQFNPYLKSDIKFCLAELYDQHLIKDITIANRYYDEALRIATSLSDTLKIRNVHYDKGILYNNLDFKKSFAHLDTLTHLTNPKDTLGVCRYEYAKGHTYAYKNDFEKSIAHYSNAISALTGLPAKNFESLKFHDEV